MKPTIEILTKIAGKLEREQTPWMKYLQVLLSLYAPPGHLLHRYQHLYSNMVPLQRRGHDDTADGFSEEYVTKIINALKVRRTVPEAS